MLPGRAAPVEVGPARGGVKVAAGSGVTIVTNGNGTLVTISAGGGPQLWYTNAPDGSIKNTNQTYGAVSVGGANAVIKLDTGPHALSWLLEGNTNNTTTVRVRGDGSLFQGKNVGQDINISNFSKMYQSHAVSMIDSNEPSTLQLNGIVMDNEDNQSYVSRYELQLSGDRDTGVAFFKLQSLITNGNFTRIFFVADPSGGSGGPSIVFETNGIDAFRVLGDGNISEIRGLSYAGWPLAHGGANAVLTDIDNTGTLRWTNIAAIVTNAQARIGPGTTNFLSKFINPTNVSDTRIAQVATNMIVYNVLTNGGSVTNSWTNKWQTSFTSDAINQGVILELQPPGTAVPVELKPYRNGTTVAFPKFGLWDSWSINGVGAGGGSDAAGDFLPYVDDAISIGSGGLRPRDHWASRIYIATPLSSGPQWGSGVGGAGMGITTDGAKVQFFRDTGITAAFNKERQSGVLQLDLAGNYLGFGTGISNCIAWLRTSSMVGIIQVGTNSDVAAPVPAGFAAAQGSGTDKGGSSLVLLGGNSTGTGRAGNIALGTSRPATGTSSSLNSYTTNFFIAANPVTLTESSATLVFSVALATNKVVGMTVTATTEANDGAVYQVVDETFSITAGVDAAYTPTVSASAPISTYQRSGTLTTAWTAVQNAGVVDVKCNAVSSLTQTTLRVIGYQISIRTTGTSVITPQ